MVVGAALSNGSEFSGGNGAGFSSLSAFLSPALAVDDDFSLSFLRSEDSSFGLNKSLTDFVDGWSAFFGSSSTKIF